MILALVDPLWTRLIQFFRTSYLELLTVLAWAALVWGLVLLLTHGIRALVRRAAAELEPSYNALRHPVRAFLWLLVLPLGMEFIELPRSVQNRIEAGFKVTLTLVALWLGFELVAVATEFALQRLAAANSTDEQRRRSAATRLAILQRLIQVGIIVVGAALFLMQFQVVRTIGVSLLASAGLVGVVVGIAAQKTIGNFVAGIQIAITQPIRVGDTVIVENEYGQIEELTFTFVVVRLWDKRQLILPVSYFLERPFQNWTRYTPELIGAVFVQADFGVPVDAMRAELQRLCEADPNWNGQVCRLIVSDVNERSIVVRATVSADEPAKLFDLRVAVREGLVRWLATTEDGRYLPRIRQADLL
ncbi:mechanosensitive ion channel [Chloracidobacterium sp. D]|jgi:small-conductance mechanosensitive channel|uniref:mechanosensitive ion channel family protein n=1 Tax=Chloracidobacterium sp. D TaxID=2821536 RepID=UPI001B8C1AFF|nr:mechanosensitive ion channel domain-containing protein [Chloracidobacterium sp. D]QUV83373.1 mechanosensitive ion channel [Chloracidobacterium sp. D]